MDVMNIAEHIREPQLFVNVTSAQFDSLCTDIANDRYTGKPSELLIRLIELGSENGCNLHVDRIHAGTPVDVRVIGRQSGAEYIPYEVVITQG